MEKQYQIEKPRWVHHQLKNLAPIHLVDVRSPAEFADGHAQGALSIPLAEVSRDTLASRIGSDAIDNQTVYLICQAGDRARQAAEKLQQQGLSKLAVVEGGTDIWRSEGLPMVRTSKMPSLERQTQIVVGGFILLMLFKGTFLHPLFYALIGVLAMGLIVAGVTAKCSLSVLLARMPWNQNKSPA